VPSGPHRFAILCVLGYLAVAWVLRFDTRDAPHNASLTYPFDTYSMYSGSMSSQAARIVLRTSDGTYHRVTDFHAFGCEPPIEASHRCSDSEGHTIAYVDDDTVRWITDHAGTGSERVEIVRRSWSLSNGLTTTTECVLTQCTAAE